MKASSTPSVHALGLRLQIGSATLLDDASLLAGPGERIAMVGPNGAGKTTLIRCLLGLTRPDSGNITINGTPLNRLSRSGIARLAAYVPQQLPERIGFTAREFIGMSRYAYSSNPGKPDGHGAQAIRQAMDLTGTGHLAGQPLSTMSGGERQRVSIAAALAQDSSILILDEPSAHLDPRQRDIIHHLLTDISRQRGITLVVATHDLNWASFDFDRIIGMNSGQTMVDAKPDAFMQSRVFMKIFNTDWPVQPHPESGRPMVLPGPAKQP